MSTIQVAVADDETLFRKGLSFMIEEYESIDLCMEASNGQELLDQLAAAELLPDVVLMDLNMPVLDGIATARQLTPLYPSIRLVVVSSHFSKAFVYNLLEIGAAAYLAKNTDPEEMELTIRQVVEKGFYYNDEVQQIIREQMLGGKRPQRASFQVELTRREQEILQLICRQRTNGEISEELFISSRTVEGHRNNLLQKLNCRNTAGLVAYAIQHDLVQIDPSQFW